VRRLDLLLGGVVLGLAAFVGMQVVHAPRRAQPAEALAAEPGPARGAGEGHERVEMVVTGRARRRSPEELAEARRRLEVGGPGTWIDDVLRDHDSTLMHWRPRDTEPLRVWIQPAPHVPNRRPSFDAVVRDAFEAWAGAGAPVRVSFVRDSAAAEVPVMWVDRFTEDDRVGMTDISGRDGEIVSGAITFATHVRTGHELDETWMRAIALHEVGHLLGLPHAVSDTSSIMLARATASRHELSLQDGATMRLLYLLPVGSLRSPGAPSPR
jgi:hypothetical protein